MHLCYQDRRGFVSALYLRLGLSVSCFFLHRYAGFSCLLCGLETILHLNASVFFHQEDGRTSGFSLLMIDLGSYCVKQHCDRQHLGEEMVYLICTLYSRDTATRIQGRNLETVIEVLRNGQFISFLSYINQNQLPDGTLPHQDLMKKMPYKFARLTGNLIEAFSQLSFLFTVNCSL